MKYDDDTFTALDTRTGKRVTLCRGGFGDGETLRKRDDTPRSKPHVERHARRLRKFQAMSFNAVLARMEAEAMAKAGADGDEIDRDDGDGDTNHPIVQLATLLVASGKFSDHAQALDHLLNTPRGVALVRTHKAAKDDPPMDTILSIMKSGGISATCAAIVAKGSTTILQDDLVAAVSKVAHERYPELSSAQAFTKIYSDPTEGRVVRDAINIAKASLAETMLGPGLPVQVVGGPAAQDVNNATEVERAREELMRIGRLQYPRRTENEVFEMAFTDPRNATIVARLYQRPTPTSIYPMPREWLRGEGSQHAKADRGEATAYGELMTKAEQYRNAHPELSISQAFSKVYTDRGNVELAKRERLESAPR
jgi:hypothetical protein